VDRLLVEALFAQHRLAVYRFLWRLVGDASAAEDLTQDVFLRALHAEYRHDGRERAWIFEIARNLARDHARRAVHRGPTVEPVDGPAPFIDLALALEIRAALGRLSDDDREMFLLREVAGLNYGEIADVCGVTPDAVRNRLHRARLALRRALSSNVVRLNRIRQ
jgi:RNA polymerase sigma-70 factor (ECF subfamily)